MSIIINWGEEVLRGAGVYRKYQAATLIRDSDRGVGLRPLSGVVVAESTPSIVLGNSAAANEFSASIIYYEPTPFSPYVQKIEDEGEIAPVDQEPPPLKQFEKPGGFDPKTTSATPTKTATGGVKPKTTSSTSDSTHIYLPSIPVPY